MKKALIAGAMTLALAASAAAGLAARPADNLPLKRSDGVMVVGLSLPSPGFQTGTVRGDKVTNAHGMEVDMALAIAKDMGIKSVQFVNISNFPDIYATGSKDWDFGLAEVTITPQRGKAVDFSTPYLKANQGVMVRKGLSPLPKNQADLKKLTLCAQTGTTGADYIRTKVKPVKALYPKNTTIMYQELENGQCDATLYDAPIIALQRKTKPNAYGPIVGQIITNENYGAVLEKGSAFKPFLDKEIKKLLANGTIGKLSKKWLTVDVNSLPILR